MPPIEALNAIARILAPAGRGEDRQSLFRRCLEELSALFRCCSAGVWLTDFYYTMLVSFFSLRDLQAGRVRAGARAGLLRHHAAAQGH